MLRLCAALLIVTGELEVMLASAAAGERWVSAVAVAAVTLPLAWARRAPLPALIAGALGLLVQATLGGLLVGSVASTIVVLALLLYCAGRYAADAWRLAGAAGAAALIAGTRVAFDAAARPPREALLTFAAVASPLLVGRWAREQRLLQRELAERAARRERNRAQAARHAAEEERARIAADLQVAVAGSLGRIVGDAQTLQGELRAARAAAARDRLAAVAQLARSALADVRRILGVLRHDGEPRRLGPPTRPVEAIPNADASAVAPPRVHAPRQPVLVDRLLAAGVAVIAATELALVASVAASATAAAVCAPLLARRRRPLVAAAMTLVAISLQSVLVQLDSFPLGDMLAMVAATYSIGAYAAPPWGVAGMLAIAAGAAAHAAVFYPDGVVAALLGGVALPWSVGRVVRGNRDLTREGRRRNEEIERSRAREARAAATRERVRIARELHDAVAHSISVIAIQAGGAEGLIERDPERAGQCAELIASVAQEALAELTRLTGSSNGGAAPSLAHVDQLAERARAAGLAVSVSVDGRSDVLPAGVDLAGFRIVQEALTNTVKHARARRVSVSVRYAPTRGRARDRRRRPRRRRQPEPRRPRARRDARARRPLRRLARRRLIILRRLPRARAAAPGVAMRLRVLIADDQSLVRAGFRLVLENHPDLEVVGEASNRDEAIYSAARLHPDVVLMDIRMPELDGIAATREITAGHQARVLVLTTYDLDEYVYDALQAGASGFLLKDTPPAQLADGIRAVAAGEALLAPTVTRRLIEEFARVGPARRNRPAALDELTPRELDVLRLPARGLSNAEIAAQLVLSDTTIKTHVAHVLSKLDLRDRVQAVVLAYESGLVTPGRAAQ